MALIGKIRKNFWFVLIVLGFALAAFVIMDMTGAAGQGGQTSQIIGRVAGQNISYKEFSMSESGLFRGSSNTYENKKNLWDFYVEKAIVDREAAKMGLGVSQAEMDELQFGPNYSPLVMQQLQTGTLNVPELNNIRNYVSEDEFPNDQYRLYWSELQKQISKAQAQTKISNLVSKAIYTPNWLAEDDFVENNTNTDFAYVKIPVANYTGPVEINDQDVSAFINKQKAVYTRKKESRSIQYVAFDVEATEADKQSISAELADKIEALATAPNDSLFALANNGIYSNIYLNEDQIPEVGRQQIKDMAIGEVYGPFEANDAYSIVKKIDQRIVPDSVSARHILKRVTPGDAAGLSSALAFIDSLQVRYDRGYESFDSLAIKNSDDGSASTGGELGTFTQGQMVPEFNDVCFLTGSEGRRTYKVTSQFGVHLIKIDDQIYNDRNNKYKLLTITQPIVPSESTQGAMYDKVAGILSENKTYDKLNAIVSADPNLSFETGQDIEADGFALGTLEAGTTSREIIKWAFDPSTEIGDVSPNIYEYQDLVNYYDSKYVLATLSTIVPPGLVSVENGRDRLSQLVKNAKTADLIVAETTGSDLASIAAQWGVEVDTARSVVSNTRFIPGIGVEPMVLGKAIGLNINEVSKPFVGTSGVFVVSPISRTPAGAPVNLPSMKATNQTAARTTILGKLVDAWKSKVKIEDSRSTYY